MKPKTAAVFSLCSVLAFGAAFGVSAYRVTIAASARSAESDASFRNIERAARTHLPAPAFVRDGAWRIAMKEEYRRSPSLLSVAVRTEAEGIRYMLPADNPYLASAAPLGPIAYGVPSLTVALRTITFDLGGELVSIDALYTSLSQGEIFEALLPGGVVAASWTLIALAFLGIAAASTPKRPVHVRPVETYLEPLEDAPAGFHPDDVPPLVRSTPDDDGFKTLLEDEAPAAARDREAAPPDIEWFDDRTEARIDAAGAADRAGNHPEGLYSPETGLGWESYLQERLDAELKRSASFEQDLVLVIALYEEQEPSDTARVACAKAAVDFFGFRDLSFEHRNRGFAFIVPNVDIDRGIRMAEDFVKKATFVLRNRRDPLSYLDLHVGLTSRAGRLVSAERLILEAESALERAKLDHDTHIVGFMANAEKYRSFIASK